MCRWCGLWIKDATGAILRYEKFCGPVCRTHYSLRADPKMMRRHVFFRDNGACADCGTVHSYLDGDWEADHIVPLMVAFDDPSLWEPDNVRILCTTPCHVRKSADDRHLYRRKYRKKVAFILGRMGDE